MKTYVLPKWQRVTGGVSRESLLVHLRDGTPLVVTAEVDNDEPVLDSTNQLTVTLVQEVTTHCKGEEPKKDIWFEGSVPYSEGDSHIQTVEGELILDTGVCKIQRCDSFTLPVSR